MELTNEAVNEAVELLANRILTPVIYMCESVDSVTFICLCDRETELDYIKEIEEELTGILGFRSNVIDIREFDEYARMDIMQNAELVHTEDEMMQKIFEYSMTTDLKNAVERKKETIERIRGCESIFLM